MEEFEKEEYELLLARRTRTQQRIGDNDEEQNAEHDHHRQQRIHWQSGFRSHSSARIFQLPGMVLKTTLRAYDSARFLSPFDVLGKCKKAITVLFDGESVPRFGRPHSRTSPIAIALPVLGIALIAVPMTLVLLVLLYGGRPPSYADFRVKERALPQHQWGSSRAGDVGESEGVFRNIRSPINGEGSAGINQTSSFTGEYQERYLRFPDHLWGHGLNNVLQEALLYALIAHTSNRSYVFEDFVWSHIPLPYTLYDFSLRPTRIPMSAFLGGRIVGQGEELEGDEGLSGPPIVRVLKRKARDLVGLFGRRVQVEVRRSYRPPSNLPGTTTKGDLGDEVNVLKHATTYDDTNGDQTPHTRDHRSISAEYFEHVCPTSERVEVVYSAPSSQYTARLSLSELGSELSAPDHKADGAQILHWWANRLNRDDVKNERCVAIRERERRVWDSNFFGTTRPLSLFPLLKASPVLREFRWSSLVENVVERTIERFFSPSTSQKPSPTDRHLSSAGKADGLPPKLPGVSASMSEAGPDRQLARIPGVLAVHLRRGDYKRHCMRLAHWGAGYMGWNRLIDGDEHGKGSFEEGLKKFVEEHSDVDHGPADEDGYGRDPAAAEKEEERRKETYYLGHCLPSIPQIMKRLGEVRQQHETGISHDLSEMSRFPSPLVTNEPMNRTRGLKEVYVLTNGWPSFVDELRSALLADGWEKVVASVDVERGWSQSGKEDQNSQQALQSMMIYEGEDFDGEQILATTKIKTAGLNKEEKGVSAAIDMGLAERAEVFVGNGFSSLSANVVMLRLAKGFPVKSNWLL